MAGFYFGYWLLVIGKSLNGEYFSISKFFLLLSSAVKYLAKFLFGILIIRIFAN